MGNLTFNLESLLENIGCGFAYFEILFDNKEKPIDLKLIDIDASLIILQGFDAEELIGKKVSLLVKDKRVIKSNWINYFKGIISNINHQNSYLNLTIFDKSYSVKSFKTNSIYLLSLFIANADPVKDRTSLNGVDTAYTNKGNVIDLKKYESLYKELFSSRV